MTVQEMKDRFQMLGRSRANVLASWGYGPQPLYFASLEAIDREMGELEARIARATVTLECAYCLDERSTGCAACGGTGRYVRLDNNVMAAMAEER